MSGIDQFLKDYEKFLFLNFIRAKGSKFPTECDGLLTIYESVILLFDFMKISDNYVNKVRDVVLRDAYRILDDIQPGHSEQTKWEIMDLRTAVGHIPDLCKKLKIMIKKQEKQGFGALTSNLNVYGAMSSLFTGLYMFYQAMQKVFNKGKDKEYYNFDDLVEKIEYITQCNVNAFKTAAPESWKEYVELFVTFDREDPNQLFEFYTTGSGYYAV